MNSLELVIEKIVFLSSDGALLNWGKHSGLIKIFQEDYDWVSFVGCFSHRLELALKDAVKEVVVIPSACYYATLIIFMQSPPKNIDN